MTFVNNVFHRRKNPFKNVIYPSSIMKTSVKDKCIAQLGNTEVPKRIGKHSPVDAYQFFHGSSDPQWLSN
ncbi:hypothetical protein SpKU43_01470 [Streptococcus canis]|nr:hypothetical protein ScOT1_17600 [Streptococcus canis]GMX35069.1 hypothetical protein SpKU43_01470 [Streptococcus canis]